MWCAPLVQVQQTDSVNIEVRSALAVGTSYLHLLFAVFISLAVRPTH